MIVTLSVASGSLTLLQTAGLTLENGSTSFTSAASISFEGTVANLNAALASLEFTAPADMSAGISFAINVTSLPGAGSSATANIVRQAQRAHRRGHDSASGCSTATTPPLTTTTPALTTPTATTPTSTRTATTPTATATTPTTASATTTTTAAAPPTLALSYAASTGATAAGSGVSVKGSGFAPGTTATVTMHSVPVRLGLVRVDAGGGFGGRFTLPADVPAGLHHIEVDGTGDDGSAQTQSFYFQVSASGRLMRESTTQAAAAPVWPDTVYMPDEGTLSDLAGTDAAASATASPITATVAAPVTTVSAATTAGGRHRGSARRVRRRGVSASSTATPAAPAPAAAASGPRTRSAQTPETREIGGIRYRLYDPRSRAHARHSADTALALFTLLGLLMFGARRGAINGGYTGAAEEQDPGDLDENEAVAGASKRSSGHSKSGSTLSSAKVKHLKFRHEAKALGDRSATWVSPLVDRLDALSLALPGRLNSYSPLAARLGSDGAYARAMFGSWALIVPLIGLSLGIVAGVDTSAAAVPPSFGLLAVIVVLAGLDATAGFLAATAFTLIVLIGGGIYGAPAVRTVLAVDIVFFAGTLAASASRPLRRVPARDLGAWYDRGADFVVGTLIGMWAISKMVSALSAIAGVTFPVAARGNTLALIFGAVMLLRYLMESASARLYPARLAQVAAPKIGFPSERQQILSAVFKTALYVFFAYAYIGWVWELYVGAALLFIPSVIGAYQGKLPNLGRVVRWMPAGVIKVVLMLVVGKLCGSLLYDHLSDKASFVDLAFVLLGLPSLALTLVGFVARDGDTFAMRWIYRAGGAGLVAFAVLIVEGVVTIG